MYDNTFPKVNYEVLEQPLHILKCRHSSGLTLVIICEMGYFKSRVGLQREH